MEEDKSIAQHRHRDTLQVVELHWDLLRKLAHDLASH